MLLSRIAVLGVALATGFVAAPQADERRAAESPRVELPPDLTYDGSPDSPAPVVFRHWTHVPLAAGRCDGCHPGRFRLVYPTRSVLHTEMDSGGACGSCHDGVRAFSTRDDETCHYCHSDDSPFSPLPEPPDGRLLGATLLRWSEDSPDLVVFDHAVHLLNGGRCSDCHPALAPMLSGLPGPTKEQMLEGASCGACHDGDRAFGVDDERCERCHQGDGEQP